MCFHQRAVNKKTNKQMTPFTEYKLPPKSDKNTPLSPSAVLQAQKPSLLKNLICSPLLDLSSVGLIPQYSKHGL